MAIGWGIVSTGRRPDLKVAPAMRLARDTRVVAAYGRGVGRASAMFLVRPMMAVATLYSPPPQPWPPG